MKASRTTLIGGTLTSTGVTPVPEPATGVLVAMGLAGLVARRRKSKLNK